MTKRPDQRRRAVRQGESRFERTARARSRRAHAHLERARHRNRRRAAPSAPAARTWAGVCFAISIGIGLSIGGPAIERALALSDEPPRVASIDVLGAKRLSAVEVARATGLAPGCPLSEIEPRAVEERLTAHPWIREARVVGLPNGAVVVQIDERVPVALLTVAGEPPLLVDARGVGFAAATPEDETSELLSLEAPTHLPEEPSLRLAVELAREVTGNPTLGRVGPLTLRLPTGDSEGWRLVFRSNAEPVQAAELEVLLGQPPFESQLQRLSQLFAEAPQDAGRSSSIDLRFADQAVLRTRLASR